MWPFPIKHCEWCEPREFRRALDAKGASESRRWVKPLVLCGVACVFLAQREVAKIMGGKNVPRLEAALPVAFSGAFVMVYLVPWLYWMVPSFVAITDDRIMRIIGNSRGDWKISDVRSYGLLRFSEYRGLALVLKDGRKIVLGVPLDYDVSRLDDFLRSRVLEPMASEDLVQMSCDMDPFSVP